MDVGYNFKIIEWGNGSMTVQIYSKPAGKPPPRKSEPLDSPLVLLKQVFGEDITEVREQQPDVNETDTPSKWQEQEIYRTRRRILDYSRSCIWRYFLTLTFSPEEVTDRADFDECSKHARIWIANINQRYCRKELRYLAVMEPHKRLREDGTPAGYHVHALLANADGLRPHMVDSGKTTEDGRTIYNLGIWAFGFSTCIDVDDKGDNRLGQYISKYILKDLKFIKKHQRRFYASHNLPKPSITKRSCGDSVALERMLDEFRRRGKKLSHCHTVRGYVDIDFLKAFKF